MTLKDLLKPEIHHGWTMPELITVCYIAFTSVLMLIYWGNFLDVAQLIANRTGMLAGMGALYGIYRWLPCRLTWLLRSIIPLLGLTFWYPDAYEFVRQLPYLDHWFAQAELSIFGCQPSLEFSEHCTSLFWGEAMNCGYYAYYFMMVGTMLFYLFCRENKSQRASFVFLTSFFIYYIIYMFVPVAGPYFYFEAIGLDAAAAGPYPDLGNYFATHEEIMHAEVRGVFSQLVADVQELGEHPMAAFPSSHVGMSTVCMILALKAHSRCQWLFLLLLPLYLLLCAATVFIKAHYLLDSICGFILAVILTFATGWIYDRFIK